MTVNGAAAILPVTDIPAAVKFFTEVLGFTEEFRLPIYAGVELGQAVVHLSKVGNPNTDKPGTGAVYIFCDAVDEYYQQIVARGAVTVAAPKDYSYGMRDFVVKDPDGNRISFGAPCAKP